jgi:hypothetical protein
VQYCLSTRLRKHQTIAIRIEDREIPVAVRSIADGAKHGNVLAAQLGVEGIEIERRWKQDCQSDVCQPASVGERRLLVIPSFPAHVEA